MAIKDGEFPWGIHDTPNQQLAHILSAFFNDPKYVEAAYAFLKMVTITLASTTSALLRR